jgi:hypothetical protein
MKCGYDNNEAIEWMEWTTTGRPKGAPVCAECKVKHNKPDNFGYLPRFMSLTRNDNECIHPGVFANNKDAFQHCWKCDRDIPNSEL